MRIAAQTTKLEASKQLASEFRQRIQDKAISDLQETISAHEEKIEWRKQGYTALWRWETNLKSRWSLLHKKQWKLPRKTGKLKWRAENSVPEEMTRGSAAVHELQSLIYDENTAYFRPAGSNYKVYSYIIPQWSQLPDIECGFVVLDS